MAYGTTQSTSVPLQGDNEYKVLAQAKAALTEDIARIGQQVEAGEAKLAEYLDLDQKVTETSFFLSALEEDSRILEGEISKIKKDADDFSRLTGDTEAAERRLADVHEKIATAQGELSRVLEQIRLQGAELEQKKVSHKASIDELDSLRNTSEEQVANLGSDIQKLRTDIASLSSVKESKLSELKAIDGRLAVLFSAEENKKVQVAELDTLIESKKRELGTVELELETKRTADIQWFSEQKAILKEKEDELATREGAVSQRSSMLDSRADALRSAKVRLEHHLGRNIDLIIE